MQLSSRLFACCCVVFGGRENLAAGEIILLRLFWSYHRCRLSLIGILGPRDLLRSGLLWGCMELTLFVGRVRIKKGERFEDWMLKVGCWTLDVENWGLKIQDYQIYQE